MSARLSALNLFLRLRERPRLARTTSVEEARARLLRVTTMGLSRRLPVRRAKDQPPPVEVMLAGRPAMRIAAPAGGRVLLWFHGGAYCLGSHRTHAGFITALARRAGVGMALPDYRLAPEHPFPAAPLDARAAWDALRAEGLAASSILLGGDSAGGGLAFALLADLLAAGERPAGVLAFSPWTDLTLAGESLRTNAETDCLLPAERLRRCAISISAAPIRPIRARHQGSRIFRVRPPFWCRRVATRSSPMTRDISRPGWKRRERRCASSWCPKCRMSGSSGMPWCQKRGPPLAGPRPFCAACRLRPPRPRGRGPGRRLGHGSPWSQPRGQAGCGNPRPGRAGRGPRQSRGSVPSRARSARRC